MFSDSFLLVVVVLLLWFSGFPLALLPWKKDSPLLIPGYLRKVRARNQEMGVKSKEKERAEAERMGQQMDKFRKQRLVVYIREKDGRKSSFEAVLIRMLLKTGIAVEPLPESDGRIVSGGDTSKLQDGLLALVGTSWHKNGTGVSYDYLGDPEGTYKWGSIYCDYRLLVATNEGKGKILGAGCQGSSTSDEEFLAGRIIHDLASTFPETQAA